MQTAYPNLPQLRGMAASEGAGDSPFDMAADVLKVGTGA